MVLTLVPLLAAAALHAPSYPVDDRVTASDRPTKHGVIVIRAPNAPVALARRSCGTGMGPPSPACSQLSAPRNALTLNRLAATPAPRAERDRFLVEERVAGMAAPGMRALLGLGSSGVALTGRMALSKGSTMRLSVDSVVDSRSGDGVYYDQSRVGLVNASLPGRYRSY